jgi:class 3 adenylate cyclase
VRTAAPLEERKVVTVLFADVVGSTTLGEGLDPEALRTVLDTYFWAMREEIEAVGGTVEKFIGDAVMAVFGVPTAHEDDPTRALRAATRMLARLERVNASLDHEHGLTLQIRIGINTGEALAATDARAAEAMVTGDIVNTAARLQTAAAPGGVLVAERTARAVRGFRFGEVTPLHVKGRREPVLAATLLGTLDEDERGVHGLRAPMVGRAGELEVLRSVYGRVVGERRPHLVTIHGDPGVGKSRLVKEFVGWVAHEAVPPTVVQGRCLPYGDGVTYWPLAEILKTTADVNDDDPADTVIEKIDDLLSALPEDTSERRRTVAALAYTIGVVVPGTPMDALEPRQVRREIHAAWRSFFSWLSADGPTLAIVEDIHWADPALLDLLEDLIDRVEGPLLLVCPARPELRDRRPAWGGGHREATSLALDPLSRDEADRLVSLLLAVEGLPPALHARILERGEGNPFFLEEIIRHLIDEGALERTDDGWRAAARITEVRIPDTVQGVLAARIDLLRPEDKRVLQLASVVGRTFWPGSVHAVLGPAADSTDANGHGGELDGSLERLRARDLVQVKARSALAGEPELAFTHVLTRDVAYGSLPRRDRADAHAAVARWIELTAGSRIAEFRDLLAHHLTEAHEAELLAPQPDPERVDRARRLAFEALMAAGDDARHRFAIDRSLRLLDRALTLADGPRERAAALEARGHAALSDYRGDLAWTSFREAAELRLHATPEDHDAIAYACARAIECPIRWPGSMTAWPSADEVGHLLDEGLRHAGTDPSEPLVRLTMAKAFYPFGILSPAPTADVSHEDAIDAGLRAADMALAIDRPDLASAALDGASSAYADLGLYGSSAPITQRRLDLVSQIDDPWEIGDIYAMAAWESTLIGRYDRGRDLADEGRRLLHGFGAEGVAMHCTAWAAYADLLTGAWDRIVEERLPEIRHVLGPHADEPRYFTQNAYASAAVVHHQRGERVPLGELLAVLQVLAGDLATHHGQGSVRAWLALLHAWDGDMVAADTYLAAARAIPSKAHRPLVEIVAAEILAVGRRWSEVPAFLEPTRAYAEEAGLLALPAVLDRLEGWAALAAGDPDRAVPLLDRARTRQDELGARWEVARTDLVLARTHLDLERSEDAADAASRARGVFGALGAARDLETCDVMLARASAS